MPELDEPELDELELDEPELDEFELDEPESDELELDELELDKPGPDEPGMDELLTQLAEFETLALLDLHAVAPQLAHYELQARLGKGAFGWVCRAWDPRLERVVALKVIQAKGEDDTTDEREIHEARALASVKHPNVVTVHEFGQVEGRVFIAMELVDGVRLGDWIATRPPPHKAQVLDVLCQVGEGLAAMHRAGLTHRDVKPENIVVDNSGRAVLVDLGLARVVGSVGTPRYMAPEVRAGRVADQRSDQFSFALVVREALDSIGSLRLSNKMAARASREDPRERWATVTEAVEALRPKPKRRRGPVMLGLGLGAVLAATVLPGGGGREPIDLGTAEVRGALDAKALARSGNLLGAFEQWARVRPDLRANCPELAGLLSIQLADELERVATTSSDVHITAWVVIGGLQAFEEAGMLEHARESRRRAVRLLRSVGDDEAADDIAETPDH